jgi:hypothetical protein
MSTVEHVPKKILLPRLVAGQGLATPKHAAFVAKLAAAQTRTDGAN